MAARTCSSGGTILCANEYLQPQLLKLLKAAA